jgi:serine/threonine protein kinase
MKEGKPRLKLINLNDIKVIGEGSFGLVLKVMKLHKPGHFAALKIAKGEKGYSAVHDLQNEARLLQEIHSPTIIPGIQQRGTLIQVLTKEGQITGFLGKYYDRGSLAQVIEEDFKDKTQYNVQSALDISSQLISGTSYLETQKIHHGDIKPTNILVRTLPDGRLDCRLGDFGGAQRFDELKESDYWRYFPVGVHTKKYVFPQLIKKIKEASKEGNWDAYVLLKQKQNVYSLGLCLQELLMGKNCIGKAPTFPPQLPLEVVNLVRRMTTQDIDSIISAQEANTEIKNILSAYQLANLEQ